MKLINFFKVVSFIFLALLCNGLVGQHIVVFQLDATDTGIEQITEVGVRGNIAPLSWTQSIPMSDQDNDGIFTSEVVFIEGKPGDRVQYKYIINDTWDNDRYGEVGNRVLTLAPCPLINPVDKWDQLDQFPLENLLTTAINYDTWFWVYTLSVGKKNGKSAEEIIAGYFKFWGDTYQWVTEPSTLMYDAQYNMATYPNGKLKIIEDTKDKVVFKVIKPRVDMMNMYNMEEEFFGVTRDDLDLINNVYLKLATKAKGWKVNIEDDGDYELITISK